MMTHRERVSRREGMAAKVKGGLSVDETAKFFNVCPETVRIACKVHKVHYPREIGGNIRGLKSFEVLAKLLNTQLQIPQIAKQLNVSRQHVHKIYQQAKEAGIAMGRDLVAMPQTSGTFVVLDPDQPQEDMS